MKKLNTHGFAPVAILAIVLVVALIGFAGWRVMSKKDEPGSPKAQTPNLTTKEILAKASDRIASEVPTVKTSEQEGDSPVSSVSFKADGYDFMTSADTKEYINYIQKNPDATHEEIQQALAPAKTIITNLLLENGFSEVANYPAADIVGEGGKAYERSGEVCVTDGSFSAGVSCVAKTEFVKVAKEVKPYVDAYRKAKQEETASTAYRVLESGTGTTVNDKYVILSTGMFGAYLYQKDGQWVHHANAQEGLRCEIAERNPDAARAFSKTCRKPGVPL